MKKLTAGIFATLLAVVSADSAYAAIASSGYVDDKVGEVSQTVTTLSGTVSGHTTSIGEIEDTMGTYGDIVTHNVAEFATAAEGDLATSAVQPADITNVERTTNKTQTVNAQSTETQYPSAKAVWTAVSSVDANASVEALKGRVDTLETASKTHATKTELSSGLAAKQDKLSQTGSASQPVYVNAEGKVTAGNTIPTVTTSITTGQTAAAQAGAVADALAAKADATDLADYVTKEAADAAYADIATESTASTASTNAQTALTNIGTLTNLTTGAKTNTVAAINEVASEAAAAATAAAGAKTAADTAQGDVDALEAVVNNETTGLAAAHTAIDAVEGRVTTAEGEIDAIQAEMDTMATSATVTSLTNRVTEAEGDIDGLEAAVNNAESGLAATNAIADEALANAATAQSAAEAAQATADKKQDKLTGTIGGSMQPVYLNNGTITAGATLGSLATKSTVTNSEVADGALAQSKINGLASSLAAKLTTPPTSEKGETGLYVLTYDGTDFQWEDIARTVTE